jgi:drug/metabolite transporter (DMT)-like permease
MAPPLVLSVYSFLFGTIFLFLFLLPRLSREVSGNNSRRGLLFFAAMGVVGGLAVTAMYAALRYSPVAVVSSVSAANPLFALLLTYLFLRHLERVSPRILLGAMLVVAGVALVTLSQI